MDQGSLTVAPPSHAEYQLGPHAPLGCRVLWGGKRGYRVYLRSSFDYGSGEIVVFESDPFFATLLRAGVIKRG